MTDRFRLTEGPYTGSKGEGKGKGVKYLENEKYLVCRGKETEENIWSVEEKKNIKETSQELRKLPYTSFLESKV